MKDMHVKDGGEVGILLEGYKHSPVSNLQLENITIEHVDVPYKFSNVEDVHLKNVVINGKDLKNEDLK